MATKKAAAAAPKTAFSADLAPVGRKPKKGEVRIRMYRQGLGDCFLLTFDNGKNIVIDCGLLGGTPDGVARIREVVKHLAKSTGGEVDALVVTHEHWDHVSGFFDARALFESELKFHETWVAWTEDPKQDIAVEKGKANGMRMQAIAAALQKLGASSDPADRTRAGQIAQTMNFAGDFSQRTMLGAFSPQTDNAMDWVTDAKRNPKYCSPDDVIQPKWLPDVSVRVLGPPKDKKKLRKMDGDVGTDMYGMAMAGDQLGFAMAVGVNPEGATEPWLPFDQSLQWKDEKAWLKHFDVATSKKKLFSSEYRSNDWRRVDTEWLNAAGDLALQLDNAVNNTSLVLAFEFGDGGDVLLFVGDAQIGNWLSWAEKSKDLLGRTIFYKVGHHGSHNATLKENGLESMTHPDLVAAIPVDQVFAEARRPNPWMMPAAELYKRLQERTNGRILRVDQEFPAVGSKPEKLSAAAWKHFQASVVVESMYIDYFCKPKHK